MPDLTELATDLNQASAWGVQILVLQPRNGNESAAMLVYGPKTGKKWLLLPLSALIRYRALFCASLRAFERQRELHAELNTAIR